MRHLLRRLAYVLIVIGLLACGAGTWIYSVFVQPGPKTTETTVIIPRGASIGQITGLLAEGGLISNSLVFRVGAMARGVARSLQAGEFLIPALASSEDVLRILLSGKTVVRRLTVVEGLTTAEVINQLLRAKGLTGKISDRPGEGRLLPETYYFSYGDSRQGLVRRMRVAMDNVLGELL